MGESPLTPALSPWEREQVAIAEGTSPLPWGGGQGEGQFPRSSRHPLILALVLVGEINPRLRGNDGCVSAAPQLVCMCPSKC